MKKKQFEKAFLIQTENWKPQKEECWPNKKRIEVGANNLNSDDFLKPIKKYCANKKWVFPKNKTHFIADLHADTDALIKSLIGAKIIKKKGVLDTDYVLTKKGQNDHIIIGGDCLDKGPSNLRLLDFIKSLKTANAKISLLAGNHDIRTFAGIAIGDDRKIVEEHMFVRMGKKTIPLFWEIYKKYLHGKINLQKTLSKAEVEKRLFPSQKWYNTYEEKMDGVIPPKKIEREVQRIKEKVSEINDYLERSGFSHGLLYATFQKAQELFLNKNGEYYWFFKEMKVAHQEGSFLFVHAGLDDFSTDWIGQVGVEGLNKKFSSLMKTNPFELYNGHIGNIFRTKYRDTEFPFSFPSVKKLHKMGINAIIHGHRNVTNGHRITLKKGMLNIECDTSLDRATRKQEQLQGYGASWLTLNPKAFVTAYSTDYPAVKTFIPKKMGASITKKLPKSSVSVQKLVKPQFKNANLNISQKEGTTNAANLIKKLASDIENGKISLQSANQTLETHLPRELKLCLKARTTTKKGSIRFELSWKA